MKKVYIKIASISMIKYDIRSDNFSFYVNYLADEQRKRLDLTFNYNDNLVLIVQEIIRSIKNDAKSSISVKEDEDLLKEFSTVDFEGGDLTDVEEKLIVALKRIKDSLRDFKLVKSADNYLDRLYSINNLVVKVK